ncbi:hypothetical protein IJT17_09300 [bacterium]|nr:hypothetical protein [bacterium]
MPTSCLTPTLSAQPDECPRPILRRANRVYAHNRGAADRLIAQRSAFAAGGRQDRFFWRAMNECFAYHFLHNLHYRSLCQQREIYPGDIRSYADLEKIPYISEADSLGSLLPSGDGTAVQLHLFGRDVQGNELSIPLEARSMRRIRRAALNIGHAYGLQSREKVNYIVLTDSQAHERGVGHVWYRSLLTQLTRTRRLFYTGSQADGFGAIIRECASSGHPMRIIGHLEKLAAIAESAQQASEDLGQLPPRSRVFAISPWYCPDKAVINERIAEYFGLPKTSIIAISTIPMQVLPYASCEAGRMHLPAYARAIVRHPQTLEPLSAGQTGRLQFLSPCLTSCSALAILSNYLGRLEFDCPCGRRVPAIAVEGYYV